MLSRADKGGKRTHRFGRFWATTMLASSPAGFAFLQLDGRVAPWKSLMTDALRGLSGLSVTSSPSRSKKAGSLNERLEGGRDSPVGSLPAAASRARFDNRAPGALALFTSAGYRGARNVATGRRRRLRLAPRGMRQRPRRIMFAQRLRRPAEPGSQHIGRQQEFAALVAGQGGGRWSCKGVSRNRHDLHGIFAAMEGDGKPERMGDA